MILALLTVIAVSGCEPKDTPVAAVSKPGASVLPTTAQKATPQQEAAKARAEQQGPAIEAALKQQQGK